MEWSFERSIMWTLLYGSFKRTEFILLKREQLIKFDVMFSTLCQSDIEFDVQYVEIWLLNLRFCISFVKYDIEFDIQFSTYWTSKIQCFAFSVITVCDRLSLTLGSEQSFCVLLNGRCVSYTNIGSLM